jgi:hypothetical protein
MTIYRRVHESENVFHLLSRICEDVCHKTTGLFRKFFQDLYELHGENGVSWTKSRKVYLPFGISI